jgi:hypothetical protein
MHVYLTVMITIEGIISRDEAAKMAKEHLEEAWKLAEPPFDMTVTVSRIEK